MPEVGPELQNWQTQGSLITRAPAVVRSESQESFSPSGYPATLLSQEQGSRCTLCGRRQEIGAEVMEFML